MNKLSYLLMMSRNMLDLMSGRSLKNTNRSEYKPNKGKINIFADHLYEILTTGAIERGYWMYGFHKMSRKEQRKYVPYANFMLKRNELNMHPKTTFTTGERFNYLCILRDKFVFGQFLSQLGFPVAKDIMIIDGKNGSMKLLTPNSKNEPINNITNYEFDAFCKVLSGECGKGVFRLTCDGKNLDGEVKSTYELKRLIDDAQCIVQTRLEQHPELNRIYPKSINTMRLITCRTQDGSVSHLPAILRCGANGNTVDNWAAGGLVIGIDKNGYLFGNGRYEFPINHTIECAEHPNTKEKFDGFQVPFYEEAVKMAHELHSYIYGIPCIGWDIAFTPDGPTFIEGNDNFEITLNQAAHGGFNDLWLKSIGE